MTTQDPEYIEYREKHAQSVAHDKEAFMRYYDAAASMVFAGRAKHETVDILAPWGCDHTRTQGTLAGALQASALLKHANTTTEGRI